MNLFIAVETSSTLIFEKGVLDKMKFSIDVRFEVKHQFWSNCDVVILWIKIDVCGLKRL